MKVSITAKAILDDKLGKLMKDDVVDLPDHKAQFYLERGEVTVYKTKVLHESPEPLTVPESTKVRKIFKSLQTKS